MLYALVFVIFFGLMHLYFKIADRYNIIDKPNQRSSHTEVTIRGGGIIFLVSILLGGICYPVYWLPVLGAFLIGVISFADDLITLSSKVRIVVHIAAVTIMYVFLNVFALPWYWCLVLYIMGVGIINIYNFMDGINGITGCYTLVILAGLFYINSYQVQFIQPDLILFPVIACVVFLFFNFRTRAKCFAGDVGSVTIAFWVIFLLFKLIFHTQNWSYIFFLAVYGIDAGFTIIQRLLMRQNIFTPHRLHLYQLLANECKWPHRLVSVIYAIVQLVMICVLATNVTFSTIGTVGIATFFAIVYLLIKPRLISRVAH